MQVSVTDQLKQSRDIISQLREMEHYANNNVEKLSAFWLKLEDEFGQKEFAKRMEKMLTHETELHRGLTSFISDYEIECNRLENEETG